MPFVQLISVKVFVFTSIIKLSFKCFKPPSRNMSFKIESLTEEGALDSSGKGIVENMSMNNAKMYINNTDFLSIKSIKLSPFKVF